MLSVVLDIVHVILSGVLALVGVDYDAEPKEADEPVMQIAAPGEDYASLSPAVWTAEGEIVWRIAEDACTEAAAIPAPPPAPTL